MKREERNREIRADNAFAPLFFEKTCFPFACSDRFVKLKRVIYGAGKLLFGRFGALVLPLWWNHGVIQRRLGSQEKTP